MELSDQNIFFFILQTILFMYNVPERNTGEGLLDAKYVKTHFHLSYCFCKMHMAMGDQNLKGKTAFELERKH